MDHTSDGASVPILVADDDPGLLRMVADCLKSQGFTIAQAPDGVTACELAEAAPPALVLLDILLPKRDGYSVLLHLRSGETTRDIPVILMSGESENEQAGIARTLGAHSFLAKPFTIQRLLSAVDAALKSKLKPAPPESR
jgi:DNA-binding response OmpR family regulator